MMALINGMVDRKNFCSEKIVYQPYGKIYDGRTDSKDQDSWGAEIKQLEPGFHDTAELANVYICLNGPAWLYYERKTSHGVVLDMARFKVYEHECQFFNGQNGPGSSDDKLTLEAILLMGERDDYRRPFMQLFTAPLYNSNTSTYENVTSLMTFGKTSCTLYRGRGSQKIAIAVSSDPEKQYSHCRLSYLNIDAVIDESLKSQIPFIKETLKNEDGRSLEKGRCEETGAHASYLTEKFQTEGFSLSEYATNTTKPFNDLLESFKTRLGAVTVDETELGADADEDQKRLQLFKDAIKQKLTAVNQFLKDDGAFYIKTKVENLEAALTEAGDVGKAIGDLKTKKEALTTAENKLKEQMAADPVPDLTADETAVKTSKADVKTAITELENKVRDMQNRITEIKALIQNANNSLAVFEKAAEDLKQAETDRSKVVSSKPEPVSIAPVIQMPKGITTEKDAPKKCEEFRPVEDICRGSNPKKVRACHFLKAAMGNPQICSQPEISAASSDASSDTTASSKEMKDLLGEEIKDILVLIEEIFTKACPQKHLNGNLAKYMSLAFQCYLVKLRKDRGAEIQKKISQTPQDSELNKFWGHVKDALKLCKAHERTLSFTEVTPGTRNYTFHALTKTGELVEKHVEHLKEQADREYSFNFVLDMHFKIFVTVMGLCMPSYEKKIPLITTMFYTRYTETFFKPLRRTWVDPKDNQVFKIIYGNFYNGGAKFWATQCMEASFIQSGEKTYRPPRDLPVNGGNEHNFFISGPLAYSATKYFK